jgi:hypothetical protein
MPPPSKRGRMPTIKRGKKPSYNTCYNTESFWSGIVLQKDFILEWYNYRGQVTTHPLLKL